MRRRSAVGLLFFLLLVQAAPAYANLPAPSAWELLAGYAVALAITLVLELGTAALMGVRDRRGLVAIALLNLVTNPAFNAIFSALVGRAAAAWQVWLILVALEATVVVVEWQVLARFLKQPRWDSPGVLRLAIAMNLVSLVVGYVMLLLLSS